MPCCRKIVSKLIIVVKVVHKSSLYLLLHKEVCPLLVEVGPSLLQELLSDHQMSSGFFLEMPHANVSQYAQKV